MKVEQKSDHTVSEASCREATGKTLAGWFKVLDQHGGVALGRRALSVWMRDEQRVADVWWVTTVVNEYEIARGDLAKDGKPKGFSICPTKSIKASPRRCFAAFASAEALDQWFGPQHDLEFVDGGHWRNADDNRATIRKIISGKSIRLLADDPGLSMPAPVEIKFDAAGTKCTVMVSIDRLQTRAEADGYRRAWGEALDRLKTLVEGS
jgi:uncharacterized protein YndB with AHSA1/START domain